MNVPKVSSGGVERRPERTVELVRPDLRRDVRHDVVKHRDQSVDSATISDESRVKVARPDLRQDVRHDVNKHHGDDHADSATVSDESRVKIARPDLRQDVRHDVNRHRGEDRADSATISDESRVRLDVVRDFTDRLRQPESDRQKMMDDVRARLDAGDLDHPDVFRAVADVMLRGLI